MRFAERRPILQCESDPMSDRDIDVAPGRRKPNPRDSWEDWTDRPIPYRLAVPDVVEGPPGVTRRAFMGAMLGVVVAATLGAGQSPPAVARSIGRPGGSGRLTLAWRELVEARRVGLRHSGGDGGADDLFTADQAVINEAHGRLARLIAEDAGVDLATLSVGDVEDDDIADAPIAMVREGAFVFLLVLDESRCFTARGCPRLPGGHWAARPVVLHCPPAEFAVRRPNEVGPLEWAHRRYLSACDETFRAADVAGGLRPGDEGAAEAMAGQDAALDAERDARFELLELVAAAAGFDLGREPTEVELTTRPVVASVREGRHLFTIAVSTDIDVSEACPYRASVAEGVF